MSVPAQDNLDREYQDIPAISPVAVILISVHVFVIMSAGIVSRGAVVSILYICAPVLIFPALSITQA